MAAPQIDLPIRGGAGGAGGACEYYIRGLRPFLQSPMPGYGWNYSDINDDIFADIQIALQTLGYEGRRDAHSPRAYVNIYKDGTRTSVILSTAEIDRSNNRSFGILTVMGPCESMDQLRRLGEYLERFIPDLAEARMQALTVAAGAASKRGTLGADQLLLTPASDPGSGGVPKTVAYKIWNYFPGAITPSNNRFRRAGELGILGPEKIKKNAAAAAAAAAAPPAPPAANAIRAAEEVAPTKKCGPMGCSIMGGSRKQKKGKSKRTKKSKTSKQGKLHRKNRK